MNVVKTSQLSIVEFLKYVSDGQDHLKHIIDRKKSNCSKRHSHWITAKTMAKRGKSFPVPAAGRASGLDEGWLDSLGSGSLPVNEADLDQVNSIADGKIRIEGRDPKDG